MANHIHVLSALLTFSTALWLLAPAEARAQASTRTLPHFELERIQLDPGALGSLVVGTGRTLPAGTFRASFQGHYEHVPLKFSDEWAPVNSEALVESRINLHLTAAFGVLSWLQVGAQVPFIAVQSGRRQNDVEPPNGSGLGTPWVGVRAAVLRADAGAPLNLALDLSAALPVGRPELLARDEFALLPRLQASVMDEGYQLGGEVGLYLRKRQDLTTIWPESVVGNELRLGGTVTSRGGKETRGEVSALLTLPLQGGRMGAEVLIGIRRHLGESGMDLYVLGGPGLGAAFDMPTFRILGGVSFGSRKVD